MLCKWGMKGLRITNVGGRQVSRFRATLTDDERDLHPLITPRLMHLRSLDSKSLFTVTQRRSPPLMMFYIFMEASFSRHFEFVINGAVLGNPCSHISLFIRGAAPINAVTCRNFWWEKWANRFSKKSAFADTNFYKQAILNLNTSCFLSLFEDAMGMMW